MLLPAKASRVPRKPLLAARPPPLLWQLRHTPGLELGLALVKASIGRWIAAGGPDANKTELTLGSFIRDKPTDPLKKDAHVAGRSTDINDTKRRESV
jgi:hypothetical protein